MLGSVITLETRHDSNEKVDRQKRYAQIIECLQDGPLTAKECAVEMLKRGYIPTAERNYTAPRLTELSKKGAVEPISKKRCDYTGKTVAVYALRDRASFEEIYERERENYMNGER